MVTTEFTRNLAFNLFSSMKRLFTPNLVFLLLTFSLPDCYSQVIAGFTVDKYNVCSGTSILLNNTSTGANRFEWQIEGIHYSYARDTSAVLQEDCYDLQEIKLIAEDTVSGFLDSVSIIVEVFDTCFFHWTGTFINCPGDTISLATNPEEISTLFTIQPSVNILNGCITCPSIQFVLTQAGTMVDRTSTYSGGCSEITTYEYFCIINAISETADRKINFSPNPLTDRLRVDNPYTSPAELKIYNLKGQQVFLFKIPEGKTLLDLSLLPAGMYFAATRFQDGRISQNKLIKL